jgi:hypothetical protein
VLDLGCDRGKPRDQGRSRRGVLIGAALEPLHLLWTPGSGRRMSGLGGRRFLSLDQLAVAGAFGLLIIYWRVK